MKQEILDYIKANCDYPEDNTFSMDKLYKNHQIYFSCNPNNCVVELDVWDELTEKQLQFTFKEIKDLMQHFEWELEEYYYNQDMLRDQLDHESYLWNHR